MADNKYLIRAISKGDQVAFEQLYKLYSTIVYNTALGYTQNTSDAEEVTQDVFVKVFRYASNFKGNSTVITWIYRITINCSLNNITKRKKRKINPLEIDQNQFVDFNHPGITLENKELGQTLFKQIDKLPHSQKTAFILSIVEKMPQKKVAEIMEISLKALESLLQRAKKNLRKNLATVYKNQRK